MTLARGEINLEAEKPDLGLATPGLGLWLVCLNLGLVKYGLETSRGQFPKYNRSITFYRS